MSATSARGYACGVQTVWTDEEDAARAVAAVAGALDLAQVGQIMAFFSPTLRAAELASSFDRLCPDIPVAGCSTAGQISPGGFTDGGLVAVAFPKRGFQIVSQVLTHVHHLTVERGAEAVRDLRAQLDRVSGGPGLNRFALCFIDGLSNCEEMIVSALGWALNGIPLVGGSAGDDLRLAGTTLLHNGQTYSGAALLLLVETDNPIRTFKHDNFDPTSKKLVVTASNSEERTVRELNAETAALEYAAAAGVDYQGLTPMSFAAHPVVVRIGGDYYCRSIQKVNADGSLTFFCAIDDGVVLTVARARDMVASVETELARIDGDVGGIDLVLGFECVLRRLDAETRQIKGCVCDVYMENNIVGFHTYGEQFNGMHLNQTLTGVAIGRGRRRAH
ncbi:MAG: FIST N-terminal domain-containing protein [Hyphomicrobiales bacterium]|nr:FIST N-terminal domain-containing protein [Hyphomicrobiales bacterium]